MIQARIQPPVRSSLATMSVNISPIMDPLFFSFAPNHIAPPLFQRSSIRPSTIRCRAGVLPNRIQPYQYVTVTDYRKSDQRRSTFLELSLDYRPHIILEHSEDLRKKGLYLFLIEHRNATARHMQIPWRTPGRLSSLSNPRMRVER